MARPIETCLKDMHELSIVAIAWYEDANRRWLDALIRLDECEVCQTSGELIVIAKLADWMALRLGQKNSDNQTLLESVFNIRKVMNGESE